MKTMALRELTEWLDGLLHVKDWTEDCSNNGLQFAGTETVRKAAFAVDACAATFEKAIQCGADILFVHHGISWGSGFRRITGADARRITKLACHQLSLYAAHLPLDAHPELGHNAILASMIGLEDLKPFGSYHGRLIGLRGTLPGIGSTTELCRIYEQKLASEGPVCQLIRRNVPVKHIGIISGGGAWPELFDDCEKYGLDCLITGTFTHESYHPALEAGTAVITLGHYRSETPGVLAVMEQVKEKFGIETGFLDFPTML